jgi:preprotein translocase subunit SecB
MTDVDAGIPAPPEQAQPLIRIAAQFTRDLSFESPRAPEALRSNAPPEIEIGVELNARGRPDGLFEVDLKLTIGAKQDNEPAFQIELLYGGLFQIAGVPEEHLEPVLLIECPRFLFPYARRIISDLTADGGFPPFQLEPLDFAAVYQARLQAQQNGEGSVTVQ